MLKPAYRVSIGTVTVDSDRRDSIGTLVSIHTTVSMTASAGAASIVFGQGTHRKIKTTDPVTIELGYSGQTKKVFEGAVDTLKPDIQTVAVTAYTPAQKLLELRMNQTYEDQTAGAVVSDIAAHAGVDTREVEDGIHFPFYVIDDRQSSWEHLFDIARICGFDLYLDPDNRLFFKKFERSSSAHTLRYGRDIIRLKHCDAMPDFANVEVRGESPASSQGTDTSHWLVKSFENYKGSSGAEGPVLAVQDAAVRTKEAADLSARGRKNIIERKKKNGFAEIVGSSNIAIGDSVEIKDAPQGSLNGFFQIRGVFHILSKTDGFKTQFLFWGVGDS